MSRRGIASVLLLLSAACNTESATSNAGDAGDAGDAATCGFDPTFPSRSSGIGGKCFGARYLLTCNVSGGGTLGCASDDPSRCDSATMQTQGCTTQCAPNEYGAECPGGTGPSSTGSCSARQPTGSTSVFYCCPCE